MSNELQVFNYQESHQIRTTQINGEAWFVAKDVCDVLGLENVTKALRGLEKDELSLLIVKSGGQNREMKLINESGLYMLIFKSRKPEAKKFTRWVTHEVLPQIRKTGMYVSPESQEAYQKLLRHCETLEHRVTELESLYQEAIPLKVLGETVLSQRGCISFKDGASFLCQHGMGNGNSITLNQENGQLFTSRQSTRITGWSS